MKTHTGTTGCTGPSVFGNVGRNTQIGPGFSNFDFSILKKTRITETTRLEFRTEIFDLFNHPNFGQPGRVVAASNFGKIQARGSALVTPVPPVRSSSP